MRNLLVVFIALLPWAAASLSQPARVGVSITQTRLTLQQAVDLALKNNLEIEIERTNVANAAQALRAALGAFDPAFVRLLLYSGLEGHEIAALCYERLGVRLDCEMVRHLQRRIEEGALRNGLDPLIAARAFLCMVAHFAQSRVVFHLQKEEISVDEYLRTMVDIFLRGITKN